MAGWPFVCLKLELNGLLIEHVSSIWGLHDYLKYDASKGSVFDRGMQEISLHVHEYVILKKLAWKWMCWTRLDWLIYVTRPQIGRFQRKLWFSKIQHRIEPCRDFVLNKTHMYSESLYCKTNVNCKIKR